MKRILLTLLLAGSFCSYGFGIGLQTGGLGLEFTAGKNRFTKNDKGLDFSGTEKSNTFYNHFYSQQLVRKVGVTIGFGNIHNPLIVWGINYYTDSSFRENNYEDANSQGYVSAQSLGVETTIDYRLYTINLSPSFSLYTNTGLGFNFRYSKTSSASQGTLTGGKWEQRADHQMSYLDVYARLPLGASIKVVNHLEFFTEGTIGLGVRVFMMGNQSSSSSNPTSAPQHNNTQYKNTAHFYASYTLMFGLRYWFGNHPNPLTPQPVVKK